MGDYMNNELKECPHCKVGYSEQTYIDNLKVCPNCGYHLRMDAWERINYLADKNSFTELYQNLSSNNPIEIDGFIYKMDNGKELKLKRKKLTTCTFYLE